MQNTVYKDFYFEAKMAIYWPILFNFQNMQIKYSDVTVYHELERRL